MTINIELNDLVNLQNENTAITQINQNSETIEGGFAVALNTTGDQMQGTLDMNSNQLINLPAPATANSAVRLQDLSTVSGGGTVSNIPAGGNTGDSLVKNSNANYDIEWSPNVSDISAGTGLVTSGSNPTVISISPTAVTSGTYGSSSAVPVLTVNAQGQLTAASTSAVVAPAGTLSGTTLNSPVVVSSLTSLGLITSLTAGTVTATGSITATGFIAAGNGNVTLGSGGNLQAIGSITAGGNITSTTGNIAGVTGSFNTVSATTLVVTGNANVGTVTTGTWSATAISSAAGTLTGTTLAGNVVASSLTSLGNITNLRASGNVGLGTETNPQGSFIYSQNLITGITTPSASSSMWQFSASGQLAGYNILSFSSNGSNTFTRADGSPTAPTALTSGEIIGVVNFQGHNGTTFIGSVRIAAITAENYTGTSSGAYLEFDTTASGSNTRTQSMRAMAGIIVGTGTTDPGAGNLTVAGTISAAAPVIVPRYTVTTLPVSVTGAVAMVTDALAPTFLGSLTGGGTTKALVFYNGSAWVSG